MIKFPKVSIAQSVVNRILNVHDEINAGNILAQGAPSAPSEPSVPDTSETGPALDAELYTDVQPSDAAPETADAIALSSLV